MKFFYINNGDKEYYSLQQLVNNIEKNKRILKILLKYYKLLKETGIFVFNIIFHESECEFSILSRVMTIPHLKVKSGNEDSPVK